MTQKTLEQHIRDLLATGYDPVKIEVHARALNEANIEVSMAGQKYSIKGNSVTHISGVGYKSQYQDTTPAEAASNAGVPTAEEGNTNSPKSDEAAAADAGSEGSGEVGDSAGEVAAPVEDEEAHREESGTVY